MTTYHPFKVNLSAGQNEKRAGALKKITARALGRGLKKRFP